MKFKNYEKMKINMTLFIQSFIYYVLSRIDTVRTYGEFPAVTGIGVPQVPLLVIFQARARTISFHICLITY